MASRPPATLQPLAVASPDIVRWIEGKAPREIGNWSELGAEEYQRAFTAAQTAGYDVIGDLYDGLTRVYAQGGTERDFAELVVPVLQQKGWLGGDGHAIGQRVALIYDTNLRMSRAAGRWQRIQRAKAFMPFLLAVTVRDSRVRHPPKSKHADHRAWQGIVLPVDHEFWTRFFPPIWFRCRCDVLQLTRSQFEKRRLVVTTEAELAERTRRLGPSFGGPSLGSQAVALARQADAANEARMSGLPAISADHARAWGQNNWAAVLAQLAAGAIAGLLGQE
jgi:hypothetical protein